MEGTIVGSAGNGSAGKVRGEVGSSMTVAEIGAVVAVIGVGSGFGVETGALPWGKGIGVAVLGVSMV